VEAEDQRRWAPTSRSGPVTPPLSANHASTRWPFFYTFPFRPALPFQHSFVSPLSKAYTTFQSTVPEEEEEERSLIKDIDIKRYARLAVA
jgi:hypothetical protein